MAYPFKVGDAVYLKNGSPRMIVTKIWHDAAGGLTVWCTWFAGTAHKSDSFPADALKLPNVQAEAAWQPALILISVDFDL